MFLNRVREKYLAPFVPPNPRVTEWTEDARVALKFAIAEKRLNELIPNYLETYYVVFAKTNATSVAFVDVRPHASYAAAGNSLLKTLVTHNLSLSANQTASHRVVVTIEDDKYHLVLYPKVLLDLLETHFGWPVPSAPGRLANVCARVAHAQDSDLDVHRNFRVYMKDPVHLLARVIEEADRMDQACAQCGTATTADGSPLKKCSSCRKVKYCSRECQVQHYNDGHKEECQALHAAAPRGVHTTHGMVLAFHAAMYCA